MPTCLCKRHCIPHVDNKEFKSSSLCFISPFLESHLCHSLAFPVQCLDQSICLLPRLILGQIPSLAVPAPSQHGNSGDMTANTLWLLGRHASCHVLISISNFCVTDCFCFFFTLSRYFQRREIRTRLHGPLLEASKADSMHEPSSISQHVVNTGWTSTTESRSETP